MPYRLSGSRPSSRTGVASLLVRIVGVVTLILGIGAVGSFPTLAAAPREAWMSGRALSQGQACQALVSPEVNDAFPRDQRKYANAATLANGTVIGFQDYWTEETDSTVDIFRATSGEGVFLAGDFPAGTPLGTVWDELCLALREMGSIVEQGTEPEGSIYALMTLPNDDGSQRFGLVRVLYANGTDVPVFAVLTAPHESFSVSIGETDGLGINGVRPFEDLDLDEVLATLQSGTGSDQVGETAPTEAPAESPASTGNEITGPGGTLFAWSDAWSHEQLEGMPPSAVILYGIEVPATIMIFEGAAGQDVDAFWAEYASTGGEVLDEGSSPDGGYYEVSYTDASDSPVGSTTPSYTLTRAYSAGTAPVLFSVVISGEDFQPSLTAARDVTANGASMLDGVDDAALIATFENGGPTGAPIFTGGDAPVAERESGNDAGNGGIASPRDIIANVPLGLPDRDADREPSSNEGEPLTYTSDIFGYTLAWGEAWVPFKDGAEVNEDEGYDLYALQADGIGTGAFSLFAAAWDEDLEARDYIAYWASDEFVEENFPAGTVVVLQDSRRNSGAVVYVGPQAEDDPELWVTVYEVVNLDDEIRLEPTLVAPVADFEDVYEDAVRTVTLDGDEVIGFFSTEEIVNELP